MSRFIVLPFLVQTFLLLVSAEGLITTRQQSSNSGSGNHWVDIWTSMPQLTESTNLPFPPFNSSYGVFVNSTIRQTFHMSLPAENIRIRLFNVFGDTPLPITGMTVALPAPNTSSTGSSLIQTSSLKPVTFSGNRSITIPNGALVVSDPISFPVSSQCEISVSTYLATGQAGFNITSHPGSRVDTWFGFGDQTSEYNVTAKTNNTVAHWYFVSAVEGWVPDTSRAFAVVGDSITDGRGSDTNQNDRWPDLLLRRMQADPSTSDIAPVNQAAGGNRILADGLGPNAIGRIDRDVLAQSGVGYAMIFEGVNDIGTAANTTAAQNAIYDALVQAYEQIITRVHTFRIPMFAATITPFSAPNTTIQAYSDPLREATRVKLNDWIMNSGKFDYVVDFASVVANPENPSQLADEYNSGDYLHPNEKGYVKMAAAFDLGAFSRFYGGVNGYT